MGEGVAFKDEGIGDWVLDRDIASRFVRCYALKISSKGILGSEVEERAERQETTLEKRTGSARGNISSFQY